MPKLVVISEGFTGRTIDVTTEKTSIGRVEDNKFCLTEPSVSSHHCEVWLKGDDIIVKDLGSTNGSFIGSTQLKPDAEVALKPGQILSLGQVEMRHETGKKQAEQQRQTVKLGEGQTMVIGKESGFAKKSNNVNKIFLAVGIVLGVVILGVLVMVLMNFSGSPTP